MGEKQTFSPPKWTKQNRKWRTGLERPLGTAATSVDPSSTPSVMYIVIENFAFMERRKDLSAYVTGRILTDASVDRATEPKKLVNEGANATPRHACARHTRRC